MIRTILIAVIISANVFISEMLAAHIIGGDVTYQCVSTNVATQSTTFKITFTMYRDSRGGGALFDQDAYFGVFKSDNGLNWDYVETYIVDPQNIADVTYDNPCVIIPPSLGVEKCTYSFNVVIPWGTDNYQVVYQRCCRNASINNILNPGETGAAFYVDISSEAIMNCNNSPVFKKFPPIIICNGNPLTFDHSAIDQDGDVLVYEFCSPLTAGGTAGAMGGNPEACNGLRPNPIGCPPPFDEVSYIPGVYSGENPMGGNPQVSLNNNSGLITGTPNNNGQYVVGVCVKEYRNGVLIGTIRRDFQFNVTDCKGPSETIELFICDGDSVNVNDSIYSNGGIYTQSFVTNEGCDSTLTIEITENETQNSTVQYNICRGDSVLLNNTNYNTEGIFYQTLVTQSGCDSLLQIEINFLPEKKDSVEYSICEGREININGNIYNTAGTFTQTLISSDGCDSILIIFIEQINKVEKMLNFSLCQNTSIIVNNETYTSPGQYLQNLLTVSGCDSLLIINVTDCNKTFSYDFEDCDALVPSASMIYEEFIPIYAGSITCGEVSATNVFRDNPNMNKHSCTGGRNGSVAMCVSSSTSCSEDNNLVTPITFEFIINPSSGFQVAFSKLVFHQKAPENYAWIAGNSGPNNYPTKFSVRILKNNVEIFSFIEGLTALDWKEELYDFLNNEDFIATNSTTFRVELFPYCAVGNGATVSAWDVDDIEVYTNCVNNGNRQVSGKIDITNMGVNGAKAWAYDGVDYNVTDIKEDGSFTFQNLKSDREQKIEIKLNKNHKFNVNALDLVLIQRHILGISNFQSPTKYHAADVNRDQKITVLDLVEIRKIILGLTSEFSNNDSYRFLNEDELLSKNNPWEISEYYKLKPSFTNIETLRFIPVKIGSVD